MMMWWLFSWRCGSSSLEMLWFIIWRCGSSTVAWKCGGSLVGDVVAHCLEMWCSSVGNVAVHCSNVVDHRLDIWGGSLVGSYV